MNAAASAAPFATAALLMAVCTPLLAAALLGLRRAQRWVLLLAPWAALPALVVGLFTGSGVVRLDWILLGAELALDDVGRAFLLLTSVIWLLAAPSFRAYLTTSVSPARFAMFYLLAMSGNLGVTVAADMISFYAGYALMTFAAYGLIVHADSSKARRAGLVYLTLSVIGEVLLFSAMIAYAYAGGSWGLPYATGAVAKDWAVLFVLIAFGVKAGALLVHVSLPLVYAEAPRPALLVLAGAMLNAGVLGWMRFLPLGTVALPEWGALCLYAGAAAAFYGVVVGVVQTQARVVLAYSSISQIGLISMALGVALIDPALWDIALTALIVYIVHHALTKGVLFYGLEVFERSTQRTERTVYAIGLTLAAAILSGAPWSSGALAKAALKNALGVVPMTQWASVAGLLGPAAVGTTLLMARFLWLAKQSAPLDRPALTRMDKTVVLLWFALVVLGAAWLSGLGATAGTTASKFAAASWPLGVGIAIAAVVVWSSRRWSWSIAGWIPPGDVMTLASMAGRWTMRAWGAGGWAVARLRSRALPPLRRVGEELRSRITRTLTGWQEQSPDWPVVGIRFFAVLLAVLAAVLLQRL